MQKKELFEIIKEKYEHLIKIGAYLPGESLPSLRKVATELGVNPNTVEKSFQCLADEGYIEIIPKKGAYVTSFFVSDNVFDELVTVVRNLRKTKDDASILAKIKDILEDKSHD